MAHTNLSLLPLDELLRLAHSTYDQLLCSDMEVELRTRLENIDAWMPFLTEFKDQYDDTPSKENLEDFKNILERVGWLNNWMGSLSTLCEALEEHHIEDLDDLIAALKAHNKLNQE